MKEKNEMRKMSDEEFQLLALVKGKRNLATAEARMAQEILWEKRFLVRERMEDDYEGGIDLWDEKVHEYLDFIDFINYIR